DGDGLPDINVDVDGDGTPDKNIKEITEWKPNKNIDGDFPYDTMEFDEPEEPKDPVVDESPTEDVKPNIRPKDPVKPSVQGYYNPATSIGGANTGDDSELMFYISLIILSIGFISYTVYSYQKNTF
ncbi:hypothetical protein D5266_09525, partial [bacterium c-19]|nr:hypothetical protein [bacterium c-19]